MLKRQVEMYPKKESMRSRSAEKAMVLYPMDTCFFSMLECTARRKVLRTSLDRVISNEDSPDIPRSIVGFVQIFSNEAAMRLKISALLAYLCHTMLLYSCKKYE